MQINQKHSENPNLFKSLNFRIDSPVGKVYIQVIEQSPGKIEKIVIHTGKHGSSLNGLCAALGETITLMLKHGISITDVIVSLSGITSDKMVKVDGMEVHSPVDAIVIALMKYRSSVPGEIQKLGRYLRRMR